MTGQAPEANLAAGWPPTTPSEPIDGNMPAQSTTRPTALCRRTVQVTYIIYYLYLIYILSITVCLRAVLYDSFTNLKVWFQQVNGRCLKEINLTLILIIQECDIIISVSIYIDYACHFGRNNLPKFTRRFRIRSCRGKRGKLQRGREHHPRLQVQACGALQTSAKLERVHYDESQGDKRGEDSRDHRRIPGP